jgi:hypothetical protein
MALAASFLGGAKSRLLPASIPFRFFASAAIFHVLFWLALLVNADMAIGFRGGPGPGLAAVHLLTLGVLTVTAIGASAQLLPVATRRVLAAVWPIKLVFWLVVPGAALLVAGMYLAETQAMIAAAVLSTLGLLLFAGLLAENLKRAGNLRVVSAFGWAALAALVLLVALGMTLAWNYRIGILPDHGAIALTHMILGGFGFMGLLAIGFSHVLIPMFALAPAPPHRPSLISFALTVAAIAIGAIGALADNTALLTLAAVIGLFAAALHVHLMLQALRSGMRKRLGLSFMLVRAAWVVLPVTLIAGLAALYGLAGPNGGTLFGFLLFVGWLLTFLLGVLQRILPFLASMHAGPAAGGGPVLMSELAASAPLKLHAGCHGAAVLILASAIAFDMEGLARIGSAVGLAGAVAFAWFTGEITWRVVRGRTAAN